MGNFLDCLVFLSLCLGRSVWNSTRNGSRLAEDVSELSLKGIGPIVCAEGIGSRAPAGPTAED